MISPLPSTPNAYALLMQEEKQREVQNTPKFRGESSSFIADNGQRSFCTNFRGQKGNYDSKKSNLSNAVTSNELSGDSFMTSVESEEHEKLLTQVQLAQVMQMLQQGPSMKSPMLLGESQNGLYILKNRLPNDNSIKRLRSLGLIMLGNWVQV
ncbi:hypothetical protein KY290_010995 [Solanum tuberosum]|uniref:Uncharacterized protein n=1 Tax=Solanum tuberosum TaxID=4113 RepID=A0ABQ7VZD0_SOLTU|nr:hypothetical protein KY290_010995 [Solanum tuberosum]